MTTQPMTTEEFERRLIETLAHLEESKRVHSMFVMPLLLDAVAVRQCRAAITASAIGDALGDSCCMDNLIDKAQAVTAIVMLLSRDQEGAKDE